MIRGARRAVLTGAVVLLAVGGALVGFGGSDVPAPVVPDTTEQFSLDLKVLTSVDHGVVYAVEQRARPDYRILSLDPLTGSIATVFTVPEDAIVSGLALSPDRSTLAVSYAEDFRTSGAGLSLLDPASGDFREVTPAEPDVYLVEPSWDPSGTSVVATQVDRRGEDEQLSVVRISASSGEITPVADRSVSPVSDANGLYVLRVDQDGARRTIGAVSSDGSVRTLPVGDSSRDLDNLTEGFGDAALSVSVLEATDGGGISLGDNAAAHGSHDVPSVRWEVPVDAPDRGEPQRGDLEALVVYDAAATATGLVSATREGLTIETIDGRFDLIASRALRLVAG